MIDAEFHVHRYIAEYCDETDKFLAKYDLSSFELEQFQVEFREQDTKNPMFDCYPVIEKNIAFLRNYLANEPGWDFDNNSYFVEAHSI